MEHLKRAHQAKEADIEHTKKLYEEQQRRRREQQQQQQQQQQATLMEDLPEKDPESETSSVSGSTALCASTVFSELNDDEDEERSSSSCGSTSSGGDSRHHGNEMRIANKQKHRKRKMENHKIGGRNADDVVQGQLLESQSKEETCKSYSAGRCERSMKRGRVKGVGRIGAEDHLSSTEMSSISEDENEDTLGGKNISFHKDSSTLSDMTDSNQSGTDGGSGGGGAHNSSKGGAGDISTSSISSAAAVVLGVESSQNTEQVRRRRHARSKHNLPSKKELPSCTDTHAETKEMGAMNTNTSHKKKRRGFHYDYKEVFLKSNVPQLIATLSGRIVVCK